VQLFPYVTVILHSKGLSAQGIKILVCLTSYPGYHPEFLIVTCTQKKKTGKKKRVGGRGEEQTENHEDIN
jgi:hypothetical protein